MGLESATTIDNLDENWPLGGDPTNRGDDHLRLIKAVLKSTFPGDAGVGFDIPITATEVELNYIGGLTSPIQDQLDAIIVASDAGSAANALGINPIGAVIMFNAVFAGIPANWQLCDGTNGTPNMTDKFVYGTNNEGDLLNAGGQADAIIPLHTHPITDQQHLHSISGSVNENEPHSGFDSARSGGASVNTALSFTGITVTDGATGGEAVTDKNLPPYIKLAFIQRMT